MLAFVSWPAHAASNCELWQDQQGIPHLKASTEVESYACLGYLHGRDRIWQMDFLRRTFEGRRAEVFGKDAIRSDFIMRVLGLGGKAKDIASALSANERARLEAYSEGVNSGAKEALRRGVYEFQELGYEPEKWTPEDSIGVLLLQSFDQTRKTFQVRIDEEGYREHHGSRAAKLFSPQGLPWDTTILKGGEFKSLPAQKSISQTLPATDSGLRTALAPLLGDDFNSGLGSNNWVIAPTLSATGNAWFANDPHLALKTPSFWYWVHLNAGGLDVIGASVPGIPLIASGTNRSVSWGLTNSYLDVSEIDALPEAELTAKSSGVKSERPLIWFRFWKLKLPFFFKTYQRTAKGWPVLPLPGPSGKAYVLKWSGFDLKSSDVEGLGDIMSASSAEQMDELLSRVGVPSWNFVFADTEGRIGYRAIGRVPRRQSTGTYEGGFGPKEAHLADVEREKLAFENILSASEMPHLLSPRRGYIATANNRQWPLQGELEIGHAHSNSFRAHRIEELLRKEAKHDLSSIRAIQCDVQAGDAKYFVPKLLAFLDAASPIAQLLRSWDFEATVECKACGIYRAWMDQMMDGLGVNEAALYRLLNDPTLSDSSKVKSEALAALGRAEEMLKGRPQRWGDLHQNLFPHLSQDSRFDQGVEALPTPGDEHSVSPGSSKWDAEKKTWMQTNGASQRLIVEMSRPPKVYSILPGTGPDLPGRKLRDPQGPWVRWAGCELDARVFPMSEGDWVAARKSGTFQKLSF